MATSATEDADGERVRIRKATLADASAIEVLIATSARVLGRDDYTAEQIDGR